MLGGGGRSWLRSDRVEEVDLGGEACGVGGRWHRAVVRRKGVQGQERRKDGGVEVGFPERGVLLQGEGVLCPFESCGSLFQSRVRAQEGRIGVAGGCEEGCVHDIVRGNLDLFGFA